MADQAGSKPGFAIDVANFASSLDERSLSPEVLEALLIRIIDTLGCMRGAADAEPVERVFATARRFGGRADAETPAATIVGARGQLPVEAAAFVNAIAGRYLDFNDIYLSREAVHPSDNLPVAFALAEAQRASGLEILLSVMRGYEVHCRFADSVSTRKGGWDNVILGAMAASVMAGSLLRLDPERQAQAINIAATANVALMQTRVGALSMWKAIAAANAAKAGLSAALLALNGVTGPNNALDGKHGLFAQVTGAPDPVFFAPGDGRLHLLETHLKAYPCQYFTQTAVDAALALRNKVRVDAIRKIEVSTFEFGRVAAADSPDKWHPTTRETADHSMPYCIAAALLDGALGEQQFQPTRIRAPDIAALLPKIVVNEDSLFTKHYPKRVPTRIRIEHEGGAVEEALVEYPTGHSRNPMGRQAVEAKFLDLAGGEHSTRLKALWRLADTSATEVPALLRAAIG